MPRFEHSDPREWLNRARSNLLRSRFRAEGFYLEDLCFDAQQAAEKAVKGVLLFRRIQFPYVHNLGRLLALLRDSGENVPETVGRARDLTVYAIEPRYPGLANEVTEEQYAEAVAIAEAVVRWAEEIILGK